LEACSAGCESFPASGGDGLSIPTLISRRALTLHWGSAIRHVCFDSVGKPFDFLTFPYMLEPGPLLGAWTLKTPIAAYVVNGLAAFLPLHLSTPKFPFVGSRYFSCASLLCHFPSYLPLVSYHPDTFYSSSIRLFPACLTVAWPLFLSCDPYGVITVPGESSRRRKRTGICGQV
jgi:hypothetical protein